METDEDIFSNGSHGYLIIGGWYDGKELKSSVFALYGDNKQVGKIPEIIVKKSLPPTEKTAYRRVKKVLTADRKFCLPSEEKTPYRMMAKSSYRAHVKSPFGVYLIGDSA